MFCCHKNWKTRVFTRERRRKTRENIKFSNFSRIEILKPNAFEVYYNFYSTFCIIEHLQKKVTVHWIYSFFHYKYVFIIHSIGRMRQKNKTVIIYLFSIFRKVFLKLTLAKRKKQSWSIILLRQKFFFFKFRRSVG